MNLTPREKIQQAVTNANAFPNPQIDYNFEEEIPEEWFMGVRHQFNPMVEKNTAKVIYKLS